MLALYPPTFVKAMFAVFVRGTSITRASFLRLDPSWKRTNKNRRRYRYVATSPTVICILVRTWAWIRCVEVLKGLRAQIQGLRAPIFPVQMQLQKNGVIGSRTVNCSCWSQGWRIVLMAHFDREGYRTLSRRYVGPKVFDRDVTALRRDPEAAIHLQLGENSGLHKCFPRCAGQSL